LAAEFAEPSSFEQLGRHLDPAWIERALRATGTTTISRRRLPAEQVVWLVIGMGLYRGESIERVFDLLDIPLPDRDDGDGVSDTGRRCASVAGSGPLRDGWNHDADPGLDYQSPVNYERMHLVAA
jgi:hypothetical protein